MLTTIRRAVLPWAATAVLLTLCLMPRAWIPRGEARPRVIPHLDKIIHFGMFAGFGLVWACAGVSPRPTRSRGVGVLAAAFVLAVGTELAQGLPQVQRDPDVMDATADAFGAVSGVGFAFAARARAMTGGSVSITAEPIDATRCRFVVDRPIFPGRWAYFAGVQHAEGSPLARKLFAIEGVSAVLIAHDKVTVTRPQPQGVPVVAAAVRAVRALIGDRSAGAASWPSLGKQIGAAIRTHVASGEPGVIEPPAVPGGVELRARVQAVIDGQINPVVAGHGGGVSILDVRDNVVYVQMWGGCQGCGLADMTLKHGVEAAIRDAVPEIGDVFDLTDHASGRNPYRRK